MKRGEGKVEGVSSKEVDKRAAGYPKAVKKGKGKSIVATKLS